MVYFRRYEIAPVMVLSKALESGDWNEIRAAVAAHPQEVKNPRIMGAAAAKGMLPALKLLHQHGADVNAVWRNYRPVHNLMQTEPHAASGKPSAERIECLRWLLANGADPELTGAWPSARALIIAAFVGAPEYVEVL